MHTFFSPLDDRDAALLLMTLTVGGSEQVHIFSALPPERRALLEEKARALIDIPTQKRVPFMVRELKNAFAQNGVRGVERMDPTWIIHGLRGASPRVVGAVLVSMSPQVVRSVLKRLPPAIRQDLPAKEELRRMRPEVAQGLRILFESKFHPMPTTTASSSVSFEDIIHLERIELFALMRDLGLVQLGQAFASVGKMALLELCRRLPRANADELVQAVRTTSQVDLPDLASTRRFLSRVVVNFADTEELFQKAGLWRLSRASKLTTPAFQKAFKQRIPRAAGELYESYLAKADELCDSSTDVLQRLQDTVLLQVQALAERGTINARWAQAEFSFHDPTAAQAYIDARNALTKSDGAAGAQSAAEGDPPLPN